MRILLFLLCSSLLCASPFEGYFGTSIGYRQDKLIFETSFPEVSGEENFKWPHTDVFLIGGELYLSYKNIYFRSSGDYGVICGGSKSITMTSQTIPNFVPGFSNTTESFTNGTPGGHVFDIIGGIGCRLLPRKNPCNLAPILGYSLHKQSVSENELSGHTNQSLNTTPPTVLISDDTETRTVAFTWYGFFAGIDLDYKITPAWNFFASYAFNWGYSRVVGNASLHLTQAFPVVVPPPTDTAIVYRELRTRKATGQNVSARLSYIFHQILPVQPNLGITFNYRYWTAKKRGTVEKIDDLTISGSQLHITGTGDLNQAFWQLWGLTFDLGFNF